MSPTTDRFIHHVRTAVLFLLPALFVAQPAAGQSLSRRMDRRLDAVPFNHQLWGVALVDASGKLLYSRNADRLFIPASNTKLVVSAVASALFPPDWTVRTSVYADGPVVDGVLEGDLVLYGRGDPTFSRRCYAIDTTAAGACDAAPDRRLAGLVAALKSRGLRVVNGDVVGDGSYFEPELVNPGWEVYDLNWWYAAPVSALGYNDNSIDISWKPGATVGAPAVITFTPDFGSIALVNQTRTVPPDQPTTIDFFRDPGTMTVRAIGDVAVDARGREEYLALPDPNRFAAEALRQELADSGIAVLGGVASTTDSTRYAHVRSGAAMAEVESRPLKDWIFPILNTSQNWFAEMTLKQLGRQFGGAGSWKEGISVERRFLIDSVGIDSTRFSLSDGSGLSSTNLVTPLAFTSLLRFIRGHPHWPTFSAGLPLAGQRGSLRFRFAETPLAGHVRAKTGSISQVNTLSGFIERADGKFRVFSVQANHHTQRGRDMIAAIDSLVVEMGR